MARPSIVDDATLALHSQIDLHQRDERERLLIASWLAVRLLSVPLCVHVDDLEEIQAGTEPIPHVPAAPFEPYASTSTSFHQCASFSFPLLSEPRRSSHVQLSASNQSFSTPSRSTIRLRTTRSRRARTRFRRTSTSFLTPTTSHHNDDQDKSKEEEKDKATASNSSGGR